MVNLSRAIVLVAFVAISVVFAAEPEVEECDRTIITSYMANIKTTYEKVCIKGCEDQGLKYDNSVDPKRVNPVYNPENGEKIHLECCCSN